MSRSKDDRVSRIVQHARDGCTSRRSGNVGVTVDESGSEKESCAVDDGAAFEQRLVEIKGRGRLDAGDLSSDELESLGCDGLRRLGVDDGRVYEQEEEEMEGQKEGGGDRRDGGRARDVRANEEAERPLLTGERDIFVRSGYPGLSIKLDVIRKRVESSPGIRSSFEDG